MIRCLWLALALVLVGCRQDRLAPDGKMPRSVPELAFSPIDEERGPPAPYPFGPDTYRTGLFTGEGITPTGLDCGFSTESLIDCRGFLASAVDGARLDVTVQVPR